MWKKSIEKSWWQTPSIMATKRSKGAPGALLCAKYGYKGPIFDYASHYHVYGGYVTW